MTRTIKNGQNAVNFLPKTAFIRSAIVAIIVGSVLTLANQRNAIFGDEELAVARLYLVFITPFFVVLFSQALGIRRAWRDRLTSKTRRESPLQTMFVHGIPFRALALGVLMGTLNTLTILAANISSTGAAGPFPTVIIAQAYMLPFLFGLVSQSIAYRKAAAQFAALSPAPRA